jgi:tetratricopeptide (TPR) repeat protein
MIAKKQTAILAKTLFFVCLACTRTWGQQAPPDWQAEVRRDADAKDWAAALGIVDREIALAPQDVDVLAWRARILTWSGKLGEAEEQYLGILKLSANDPDNWLGLSNVYFQQGKTQEALNALDRAIELDPKRADLHEARARVLRALGNQDSARSEFQRALDLNPTSVDAHEGLLSLRGEARHTLQVGQDADLFNFASANNDEWVSLVSRWTSHWTTSFAGNLYQRGAADAGKFVGSVTAHDSPWGALTLGAAIGHDNAIIPKSEAFFELDHGFKISETKFVRGVEFVYGQHWYWYSTARILTLSGTGIAYLPRDWTLSLRLTGARSAFAGTGADWRPSGISRLGFPLARWGEQHLSGNVFFAVGTESFGEVDQIGQFSSQTYGGGFRYQMTPTQFVIGYAGLQQRTQDRTDTSFGLSYGIHF